MDLHPYSLNVANTELHLLPQNAIYWPLENTLLVADLHLGKEHVFNRRGIAIPEGPSIKTLHQLSELLHSTGATQCVVLGDFFHDVPRANESWLQQLSQFLDEHSRVKMQVTAGNHDKKLGQAFIDHRIDWHDAPIQRGPFVLQHEPGLDDRGHVLAGHIHPVITLGQHDQRRIRSCCFWHQPHCTVLPAFGLFTGGYRVSPAPADRIFLTGNDRIMPVPPKAISQSIRSPLNLQS